jgi:hypothetical protein
MLLAVILLGATALGGLFTISLRFRGGNPPLLIAGVHGLIGASGLIALAVAVLSQGAHGLPLVSLIVLVAAALLGFFVVSFHLRGRLIPLGFALFHAFLAILGYTLLLAHFFKS